VKFDEADCCRLTLDFVVAAGVDNARLEMRESVSSPTQTERRGPDGSLSRSSWLDDQKTVSIRIAKEELWRHWIRDRDIERDKSLPAVPLARDFGVDGYASIPEGGVIGFDIFRRKRTTSLIAASGLTFTWRHKRQSDNGAGRRYFNPAITASVLEVDSFLKSKFFNIEVERLVLICNRDEHGRDLANTGRG
jgi:hypothetical protein